MTTSPTDTGRQQGGEILQQCYANKLGTVANRTTASNTQLQMTQGDVENQSNHISMNEIEFTVETLPIAEASGQRLRG